MSERLFLVVLLCGGVVFLVPGMLLEVPFAYDPLGPKAFPIALSGSLILLCLASLPDAESSPFVPQIQVIRLLQALLLYLATFHLLGFMPATAIAVYLIARSIGSSWMQGLLTGMIIAITFYGVFHFLLQVPLPLGAVFRLIG